MMPLTQTTGPVWELVEIFDNEHSVVARYTDEAQARKIARQQNLAGAPVEYGDCWGPDHYVRRAD